MVRSCVPGNGVHNIKDLELSDGSFLVKTARATIRAHLTGGELNIKFPKWCDEKRGVFVTLNTKEGDLRGCIGFPLPVYPLKDALVSAATSAATEDPRFPEVVLDELDGLVVEVSVLTVPEQVKDPAKNALKEVVVGRDGLIIQKGPWSGLLLPQVPVEWKWNVKEFLDHTCNKAGLPAGAWKEAGVKLSKFSAEVFSETAPSGRIVKKELETMKK